MSLQTICLKNYSVLHITPDMNIRIGKEGLVSDMAWTHRRYVRNSARCGAFMTHSHADFTVSALSSELRCWDVSCREVCL